MKPTLVELRDRYYAALAQMCGDYSSEKLALMLVDAELASPKASLRSVAAHVRAALNPNKPDYFKTVELVALMGGTGSLAPLEFMALAAGCKPPERMPEAQLSLVRLHTMQRTLKSDLDRVEKEIAAHGEAHARTDERILFCSSG